MVTTRNSLHTKNTVSLWDLERMQVVEEIALVDPISTHLCSCSKETFEIVLCSLKRGGIRMLDCRTGTMLSGLLGEGGFGGFHCSSRAAGVLRPLWDPINPNQIMALSSNGSLLRWDIRRLSSGVTGGSSSGCGELITPPMESRILRGASEGIDCLQADMYGYGHVVSHWRDGNVSMYPLATSIEGGGRDGALEPSWQVNVGHDLLDCYGASKPYSGGGGGCGGARIYIPSENGVIAIDCLGGVFGPAISLNHSSSLIRSSKSSLLVMDFNEAIVGVY